MFKFFLKLSFLLLTLISSVFANEELTVQTYHAPDTAFMSNSHLIQGRDSAILIDAQFFNSEGRKVIDLIESTGKQLSKIVITHSHPDHYYGLEVIGAHYNKATIIGSKFTIKEVEKSIAQWSKKGGIERKFASTSILPKDKLIIDGKALIFLTLKNGESPENTVIYIPSIKSLFIGDLASNDVHMWLAEGNSKRWLTHLDKVRQLGQIDWVYPGHGLKGDISLIHKAEKYIKDFQTTISTSADEKTAIATMISLYPHYKMREILIGSIMSAMARK
jgi:glyoxylase-like metal-dependent hydrolase (beta-lactamase superfamily II)